MVVTLNSSQVQQNFGAALDRALRGEDVVVARYGTPRAAMVEYGRYQQLVDAARALSEARVAQGPPAAADQPGEIKEAAALYQWTRDPLPVQETAPLAGGAGTATMAYRYVTQSPGICGGRPIIRGTRIPVRAIVGYHKLGLSADEILAGLPHLTPAQVYEALSYYYDHAAEIEQEIQEERLERLIERYGFPTGRRLDELEAVLKSLPTLNASEAASFAGDIAAACAQLPQEASGDPWAS
jgi:uncharacterized protein (DUF433 family)/antitoxin (DNA-binding transcriptional repressor) of toxin-antitoxin stability system